MNKPTNLAKSFSLKKVEYSILRQLFKTVGKMSKGICVGWQYGFDSGESLDYVYENKARGCGPIGRLLDRIYLNSAGWSGIRVRGEQLKESIHWAIEKSSDTDESIELIDIASGPGRYVLDVLKNAPANLHARLYDWDEKGLEIGREKAKQYHLENTEFIRRNAFEAEDISSIGKQADIAIASGLYELFPSNALVKQSLAILSQRVKEGGYLIYTNQPWHPQLEFISEVLTNRDGDKWVMRCRSQEEMDQLVKEAGFEKLSMKSDPNGIFTVSIATKRSFRFSAAANAEKTKFSNAA